MVRPPRSWLPNGADGDGPTGQAIALHGTLPAHPQVRPRLGADPGRYLGRLGLRPDLISTELTVALNGRIATVAQVAPEGKDSALRFGGILPGELFTTGANHLEVLAVDGNHLRRLPLQGE